MEGGGALKKEKRKEMCCHSYFIHVCIIKVFEMLILFLRENLKETLYFNFLLLLLFIFGGKVQNVP